jgi:hypothetical protein
LAVLADLLGGPSTRIYQDFGTWQVDSPLLSIRVVPFVGLVSRPKSLFFWSACLLTMYVYTLSYQALLDQDLTAVVAINVRNAMLVGFLAWVMAPDLRGAIGELAGRASDYGAFGLMKRQRSAIAHFSCSGRCA